MAWLETCVMDLRIMFISELLKDDYNMTELCERFGISRKTGYKWLGRYIDHGAVGLDDISRAPHNHPGAIDEMTKSAMLSIKQRYPYWGAVKIRHRLGTEYPDWKKYPCVSTISLFLKKQGLVTSRKRILRSSPTEPPLTRGKNVNDVWCADFKGHFKTGDGKRCNPLTISDDVSRYLLCCRHVEATTHDMVKMQFERVFREFGLPLVIRTDNGHPFASHGLCGLSRISVWWIRLGIHPERIEAGKPQQNGRHERIHLTLKNHTASPAARNIEHQQKRFDEFMQEYNNERPHEALGMKTPGQIYCGSVRQMPKRLGSIEYADGFDIRKVGKRGEIYLGGKVMFLSESLMGEYVGIEQIEERTSRLWFCNYMLGTFDHESRRIKPAKMYPLSAGVNPCPAYNSMKVLPMSSE